MKRVIEIRQQNRSEIYQLRGEDIDHLVESGYSGTQIFTMNSSVYLL